MTIVISGEKILPKAFSEGIIAEDINSLMIVRNVELDTGMSDLIGFCSSSQVPTRRTNS